MVESGSFIWSAWGRYDGIHYDPCALQMGTSGAEAGGGGQDPAADVRPLQDKKKAARWVRLKIIGHLVAMHDSDLPTFWIISLPIIFKRTVHKTVDIDCGICLSGDLAKSGTRTTDWPTTILTVLYRYTRVLYCTSTLYTTVLY